MLKLLSICVISILLLPFCRGSTTPPYDEVTTTEDYTDFTFDYSMAETVNYDGYEVLIDDNNKVGSVNSEASSIRHGCYAIILALAVQQFCQQT